MTKRQHSWRRPALYAALIGSLSLAACGGKDARALVEDGRASVAKKDYASANVQLKSALEKDPKSVEARQLLGESLFGAGDAAGAAVELGKALEQGADANKVMPLLAQALLRAGDLKRLTQSYSSPKLSDKEAQAAVLVTVASAWAGLSDPAKAAAVRAEAAALAPEAPAVVLMRSRELAGGQKFAEAVALVDKLLAAKPASAETWLFKGDLLSAGPQGDVEARKAYLKALELDRTLMPAHFSLVNLYLRKNDLKSAKAQAEQMRAVAPKHPLSAYVDAQIAFNSGDYTRARELTQELMRSTSPNIGVLLLAGTVALQSRDLIQAETSFAKVQQLDPEVGAARLGLARVYLDLNQPARALTALQPLLANGAVQADALTLAGNAQLALGDPGAAEALFTKASKVAPDNEQVKTALALAHLARGSGDSAFSELAAVAASSSNIIAEQAAFAARLQRRQFDAALALVDQIAKKQPDSPMPHELRGRVYLAQRDYANARKAFEQQSKADPKNFGPVSNLAALDLIDRKPDAARKRLQDAIEADPKNPYALMTLAQLQSAADATLDDAKQLMTKAIELAPQLPEPRLQLIALTLRKRLYKEALVAAQEALAALPGDPNVQDAVGRAQMEAGDVEQATKTFRKMAGAATSSGLAYTRLADVYRATGRRDLAESSIRQALQIEPGMQAAQAGLIDLLIADKRNAEAVSFIKRMQQDAPKSPAGYNLEATYQLRMKNPEAALAAYRDGLAKTAAPELATGLHRTLMRERRAAEADRFAASWMQDHPQDNGMAYQVAESWIGRGQFDRAETQLRRLTTVVPDNVLVLNNLAYVLLRQGKPGALPYIEKAVSLAPDSWPVLDTLASVQAADKQFDRALATQKRAVELAPNSAPLRLRLADLALQSGDKALARSELTRLKELGAAFKQQDEVDRLLKTL